jgi:hypothetical protein
MILSHKHKFILLHAGKCAGCSVRRCLSNIIEENQVKIPKAHPTLSELQEIIAISNHDPKEYMIITMVRNPFDRMVSWYCHALYITKSFTGSFEDFCRTRLVNANENLIPPYEKSDHVLRYEYLQQDFNSFLNLIGLPPSQLPHCNKNPDRPKGYYRELYTKKSKQITEEYFALVIEMFGYEF